MQHRTYWTARGLWAVILGLVALGGAVYAVGGPAPDAFEPDDSASTARTIGSGQTQSRTIHSPGDVDWVAFTVSERSKAVIDLRCSGGSVEAALYGPDSDTALVSDYGAGSMLVQSEQLQAGTYYLRVQGDGGDGVASYTLSLTLTVSGVVKAEPKALAILPDAYEADNVLDDATVITDGETQTHSLHTDTDLDWLKFTITRTSRVRIRTTGRVGDTMMELWGPDNYWGEITPYSFGPNTVTPGRYIPVHPVPSPPYYPDYCPMVFNDDNGPDLWARIELPVSQADDYDGSGQGEAVALNYLRPGTYYVCIGGHGMIESYDVSLEVEEVNTPRIVNVNVRDPVTPEWKAGDPASGSLTVRIRWQGFTPGSTWQLVIGCRDGTGTWAGGAPQLVMTITAPNQERTPPEEIDYDVSFLNLATPALGTSGVWLRLVEPRRELHWDIYQNIFWDEDFMRSTPHSNTDIDWRFGTVVGYSPGLNISQQNPAQWTAIVGTGQRYATIGGTMTVQLQMPTGVFVSRRTYVVVGLRNAAGVWVGGTPQVICMDNPPIDLPHTFPNRAFGNLALPTTPGTYQVWARAVMANSAATAIRDFKLAVVVAEGESDRIVGAINYPSASLTMVTTPTIPWWAFHGTALKKTVSFEMLNGWNANAKWKAVIGVRDAAGTCIGTPVVLVTDVPPVGTARRYLDRPFSLIMPKVPGAYTVWMRMVQTSSNTTAIANFRTSVVAVEDALNKIVAPVTVP